MDNKKDLHLYRGSLAIVGFQVYSVLVKSLINSKNNDIGSDEKYEAAFISQ